ncbi:MAG: redoxin domain-containing protein [Ginsengibacter sp.]
MNKFILFVFLSAITFTNVSAQENTATDTPVYLRFPTIPQFVLAKTPDSTTLTREHLKKKVNTLFFMFSPDCNHCQYETEEIIKNLKKFKDAQIIMISYFPWDQMMTYYNHYKIGNYPQITMARDNNYFFPTFFSMNTFPSTYIYDKQGKFKKSFEGAVKIEDILNEL